MQFETRRGLCEVASHSHSSLQRFFGSELAVDHSVIWSRSAGTDSHRAHFATCNPLAASSNACRIKDSAGSA